MHQSNLLQKLEITESPMEIDLKFYQDYKDGKHFLPVEKCKRTAAFMQMINKEYLTAADINIIQDIKTNITIVGLSGTFRKIILHSEAVYWLDKITKQWFGTFVTKKGQWEGVEVKARSQQEALDKLFLPKQE